MRWTTPRPRRGCCSPRGSACASTPTNASPRWRPPAPPDVFHEETVPSFAAQTVFRTVSQTQHAFTYREAALNPTAPADRASDFEVGLIQRFRADPKLAEISGDRSVGADRVFYLARPIRITDPACIVCHDTPARAPPAMIAKYGPANGFGWKLNEVVGVQQLSLPVTEQFRDVLTLAVLAGAGLTVIFLTAYLVLASALEALVARPLTRLGRGGRPAPAPRATPRLRCRPAACSRSAAFRRRCSGCGSASPRRWPSWSGCVDDRRPCAPGCCCSPPSPAGFGSSRSGQRRRPGVWAEPLAAVHRMGGHRGQRRFPPRC